MKPKIVTSYRPHGKWGDFLAAIVPGLWCLNILTNSNFILRLMEWQNETSLFLVRIRARQWYWVYKFEMKNLIEFLSVPKNIGRNKWFFSNFGDIQYSENYFNILRIRFKNERLDDYWSQFCNDIDKNNQEMVSSVNENFLTYIYNDYQEIDLNYAHYKNPRVILYQNLLLKKKVWSNNLNTIEEGKIFSSSKSNQKQNSLYSSFDDYNFFVKNFSKKYFIDNTNSLKILNNYANVDLYSRFLRRSFGTNQPFRIMKNNLEVFANESNIFENEKLELFKVNFNEGDSTYHDKNFNDNFFFTIKQLKYKRRMSLPTVSKYKYNEETGKKELIFKGKSILLNNNIFSEYINNPENIYKLVQKNKSHDEQMPVNLTRRLLRTRRTLVLPAHMNITLITNSFDVVHSWFVPGLGLKLDCVPGRSTHHTLYIDNVGFYYGQCAEICGRYHHHMPIRICALPFEHFLIWWNVFGLPKILFQGKPNNYLTTYGCRKYLW